MIEAINRAHLNHYIGKPWDETALLLAVENLLRQYRLVNENQQLIASLSAKNQALLEMNRELEAKIHERTHELAEANARLAQLAVTDGLTGLYNHRHFHERLTLEVERSQRSGLPLSLLMLDVDHFKQFNDTFGHPAGDEVLRQLARVLADTRRANDVVARYGGEEFAVILVDTAKFTAAKVAERVRERVHGTRLLATPRRKAGQLAVSIGVATFPDDGARCRGAGALGRHRALRREARGAQPRRARDRGAHRDPAVRPGARAGGRRDHGPAGRAGVWPQLGIAPAPSYRRTRMVRSPAR